MRRMIVAFLMTILSASAVFSQQMPSPFLQCGSFTAKDPTGQYGKGIEVQVTRTNATPSMDDDYTIVGGNCEFQAHDQPSDLVRIEWQKPIANGYSCKAGPAGATSFVTTTATLFACRAVDQPIDANPIDSSPTATKPTSDVAVITRTGLEFQEPLKYDYRVCNVDSAAGINIGYYDHITGAGTTNPAVRLIHAGFCMELGAATYIDIQESDPANPNQHVYYNRFPAGSFGSGTRIVAMPSSNLPLPEPGTPQAGAIPTTARCTDITNNPTTSTDLITGRKCQVALPSPGNYRICFNDIVVDRIDFPAQHWWPSELLQFVLDSRLIPMRQPKSGPSRAKWNWVFPNSCSDYYNISQAHVVVVEAPGYSAKNISSIHMTLFGLQ